MNLIPTKVEGTETGRGWWGLTSLDSPVIFTQTDCLRQAWKPEEFSRVFLQKKSTFPYNNSWDKCAESTSGDGGGPCRLTSGWSAWDGSNIARQTLPLVKFPSVKLAVQLFVKLQATNPVNFVLTWCPCYTNTCCYLLPLDEMVPSPVWSPPNQSCRSCQRGILLWTLGDDLALLRPFNSAMALKKRYSQSEIFKSLGLACKSIHLTFHTPLSHYSLQGCSLRCFTLGEYISGKCIAVAVYETSKLL